MGACLYCAPIPYQLKCLLATSTCSIALYDGEINFVGVCVMRYQQKMQMRHFGEHTAKSSKFSFVPLLSFSPVNQNKMMTYAEISVLFGDCVAP